jgi:beta-galactosidase
MTEHATLLEAYKPDPAAVGIWFSPRTYYLQWSEEGDANRPMEAIQGVARALVRRSVPYTIVEEDHLDVLSQLKLLYMPRVLVLNDRQEKALVDFVERGGTIVTESELGAFGENGVYRYPEERVFAEHGLVEVGRRPLVGDSVEVTLELDGARRSYTLPAAQWTTPVSEDGLVTVKRIGAGRVIALGTYVAEACFTVGQNGGVEEFERLLVDLAEECGVSRSLVVGFGGTATAGSSDAPHLHVRTGVSNGTPVCFVVSEAPERDVTLTFAGEAWQAAAREGLHDLISGAKLVAAARDGEAGVAVVLPRSDWGVYVLVPASDA